MFCKRAERKSLQASPADVEWKADIQKLHWSVVFMCIGSQQETRRSNNVANVFDRGKASHGMKSNNNGRSSHTSNRQSKKCLDYSNGLQDSGEQ